ncbi:hypothetical protein BdWA1_001182 [Babesia duncani]|uniref:Uncharacterized protein n=1 Tax=Babesia duncani TaxID=323732 RepID=A0AAD9PGR5_9APIC|nr:hypothetical protein BdWA1_004179 [Babesia duncani]KAK2198173.1 hypothetical protein BdWA1_001182 [Babesia duncani]
MSSDDYDDSNSNGSSSESSLDGVITRSSSDYSDVTWNECECPHSGIESYFSPATQKEVAEAAAFHFLHSEKMSLDEFGWDDQDGFFNLAPDSEEHESVPRAYTFNIRRVGNILLPCWSGHEVKKVTEEQVAVHST